MTAVTTSPPRVLTRRDRPPKNMKRARVLRVSGAVLMTLCALATAGPLLVLAFNALKTNAQISSNPLTPPLTPQLQNIADAWKGGDFGVGLSRNFLNSVIVTVATVVVVTFVGCLAGYALGSMQFRFEKYVTISILIILAVPTQATLIPVFEMMGRWHLRNTYLGIVLVYSAFWMPFSVLLLRAAFRAFPKELLDASRVDGASEITTFWKIVIPVLKGPIVGVAILNTIGIWSELLFSYVLMNEPSKQTLPAGIISYVGAFVTDYRLLYAGILISVLPVLIFYVLLSRMIRKGVSAGSLK